MTLDVDVRCVVLSFILLFALLLCFAVLLLCFAVLLFVFNLTYHPIPFALLCLERFRL